MAPSIQKYSDILGLDIGTSFLKLVWLRKGSESIEVRQTAVKSMPKSDIRAVLKGNAPLTEVIKSAVSQMGCPAKKVFLCISGPNLYTKRLSVVSMPDEELKEAVKWALKDQISQDIENVLIDFKVLGRTEAEQGAGQTHILAAIAEKEFVFSCVNAITAAGLTPAGISLAPFVFGVFFQAGKEGPVTAVLDIGSLKAELTLFKDGVPQFSRLVPGSGGDFTKAMTAVLVSDRGKLELTYDEAESLKIDAGIPDEQTGAAREGFSNAQILSMLRPVLEKLTGEIKRSFDYGRSQLKLEISNKVYLTGGGSLLKNLDKALAAGLGMEVAYLDSLSGSKSVFLDAGLAAALAEAKYVNLLIPELMAQKRHKVQKASLKLVAFVSTLLLLVSYLFMELQIYGLQKQIKIAMANFNAMQEVTFLKGRIDKITGILSALTTEQHSGSAILKRLSNVIPMSIELDSFVLKDDGGVDIKGTVASARPEVVLANFMKSMQDSGIFKNVKISSLQKDINQVAMSRFAMSCEVLGR